MTFYDATKQIHRLLLCSGISRFVHDIALTTSCVELPKVLYIYDAIVTSDRAAECFLSLITRPTGASVLFIANKVISLIVSAMELGVFASFPSDKASVPISPVCPWE